MTVYLAKKTGPDGRLDRVWFGRGADLKLTALRQARDLARAWRA